MNYDSLLLENIGDIKNYTKIADEIIQDPKFYSTNIRDYLLSEIKDDNISLNKINSLLNLYNVPINSVDKSLLKKCYSLVTQKIIPKLKMSYVFTESNLLKDFVTQQQLQDMKKMIINKLRQDRSDAEKETTIKKLIYNLKFFNADERQRIVNLYLHYSQQQPIESKEDIINYFDSFLQTNKEVNELLANKLRKYAIIRNSPIFQNFLNYVIKNNIYVDSEIETQFADFVLKNGMFDTLYYPMINKVLSKKQFINNEKKAEIINSFSQYLQSQKIIPKDEKEVQELFNLFIVRKEIPSIFINKNLAYNSIKELVPDLKNLPVKTQDEIIEKILNKVHNLKNLDKDELNDIFSKIVISNNDLYNLLYKNKISNIFKNYSSISNSPKKEEIINSFMNYLRTKKITPENNEEIIDLFMNFISSNESLYNQIYKERISNSLSTSFKFLTNDKKEEIINSFTNYLRTKKITPEDETEMLHLFNDFLQQNNRYKSFVFFKSKGKKFELKTKLWKFLLGLLIILLVIVLFIYIKNKIKFGKMYTIKDLIKDIWKKIKTISLTIYEKTTQNLYKIMGTIFAISICVILLFSISKVLKINIESFPISVQILIRKIQEKLGLL